MVETAANADETAANADESAVAESDGSEGGDGEAEDEVSDCDGAAFGWGSRRSRLGGILNWRRGRTASGRRR